MKVSFMDLFYSNFSMVRMLNSTWFSIVRTKNAGPDRKPIQIQSFRFSIVRNIQ